MINSTTFNFQAEMYNRNKNKNLNLSNQNNKQTLNIANMLKSTEYKPSFGRGVGTNG